MRQLRVGILLMIAYLIGITGPTRAESLLVAPRGGLLNTGTSLIKFQKAPQKNRPVKASLFTGNTGSSLFAPLPPRIPDIVARGSFQPGSTSQINRLRDLIGQAESVLAGYDAVQHGAKKRPANRPTQMTLGDIYDWIDATPGQPHAIGRYQFIPKTLRRLARSLGAKRHHVFSPRLQDQLSDILLAEAGLHEFTSGTLTRQDFMHNLSKIWAGLPTSSGKSYYHGFAGNKASITWTHFDTEMARIFG